MAITFSKSVRIGSITLVTVTSSLTGTVYFHWYLDGAYTVVTTTGSQSFALPEDGMARIEVVDTNDPDFDALAAPPAFFPARFTVHWVRSLSADVAEYLVEFRKGGAGSWTAITRLPHDPEAWDYSILTDRLDDISFYEFRISSIDAAGNVGAGPIETEGQSVYRVPDAPRWTFTWSAGTQRVTYAAAA